MTDLVVARGIRLSAALAKNSDSSKRPIKAAWTDARVEI